jgi:hypothetical protein
MRVFDNNVHLFDACKVMKYNASMYPYDGISAVPDQCRWLFTRYPATVIFTKESGYHTGGWWKNPEYERCWHLSTSFKGGSEKKGLAQIIEYLFGAHRLWLWVEPPCTTEGKSMDVWHYRLFCDVNWQPIKPRGEVYNTEFTERGWKSFSELNQR